MKTKKIKFNTDLFPSDTPLSDIRLLFIDTETTGLHKDQFWNIAWMSCKKGKIIDVLSRNYIFRPEYIEEIPDLRVRNEYLCNPHLHNTSCTMDDAIEALNKHLPNSLPIVFNKGFDIKRLNRELKARSLPTIDILSVFDPMHFGKRLHGKNPNIGRRIDKLSKYYEIPIDKIVRHTAYYDCELTLRIFLHQLQEFTLLGHKRTFRNLVEFTYGK